MANTDYRIGIFFLPKTNYVNFSFANVQYSDSYFVETEFISMISLLACVHCLLIVLKNKFGIYFDGSKYLTRN